MLIALLGAGIPALVGAARQTDVREPCQETRLYFGSERSDGRGPGGEKESLRFLDREITPAFPEEARERSGRIERIRQAYEDQDQQDSVGRPDDRLTTGF